LEEVLKQPAEDLGKNQGDAGDLAEELEDIKVTIGNKLKRLISMADRRTAKGKPVEQRTEEEEAQLDQLARIKAFADLDKDEIVRQLEQDYLAGGDEAAADDAHEGEEKAAVAVADEAADGDEAAADGPAVGGDEEPAPTMLQTILSMGEGTEFNSDLRSFKRGITNALEDIRDLRERHNKKQNPIALGIARTEAIQRRIGQRIAEQKNIQETQLTAATKAYQAKIYAAAQNVDHLHVEMFDTYGSDRRKTIGTLHKAVTKTKTTVEQNQALTLAFRSALRSLYKFRTRAMQKADRDLRTAAPDQQGTAFLMRVHKKVERDVQSYAQEILNTTANYIAAWNRRHADDADARVR
jgi:hypothetical protein